MIGEWLVRIGLSGATLGFVTWMLMSYNPDNKELWEKLTPYLFVGGVVISFIGVLLLGGV
jgi:hypothetical protein